MADLLFMDACGERWPFLRDGEDGVREGGNEEKDGSPCTLFDEAAPFCAR